MSYTQLPCNYRTSVKALIKKDGKILLAREKDLGWEFPGGGLDHGEKPKECLTRELQEELSVTPLSISDNPLAYWTFSKVLVEGNSPVWFAFVLFEVEIDDAKIVFGEEAVEIGYFRKEEIKDLDIQPNTKPYFDQAK